MAFDVFFISYREHNAEENWKHCKVYHPNAMRIHGVKGIDRIHLACDTLATTDYFWTVDGDNWLLIPLHYEDPQHDLTMFSARDPVTHEKTLLGGVKLWRKGSIINKDMSKGDFSLNATKNKTTTEILLSETRYNSSAFDAWKTSFRHCVKLMSVIFRSRPNAKNIDTYIEQWRSCGLSTSKNSNWAYQGYLDAEEYVGKYDNDMSRLNMINDYDWLENYFREKHGTS